jgi:hypothetical protein
VARIDETAGDSNVTGGSITALREALVALCTALAKDIFGHRMRETTGAISHFLTIRDTIATVCREITLTSQRSQPLSLGRRGALDDSGKL